MSIIKFFLSRLNGEKKLTGLGSGKKYQGKVQTNAPCYMLEMEDANFHHNSAVLLPDFGDTWPQQGTTQAQQRITGLAVLYACYKHLQENPEQKSLVIGHTDRSGGDQYNQALSELRAENVLSALVGDRSSWVRTTLAKNKVEDYQQILLWLTHGLGWGCDPGAKTNAKNAKTRRAVEKFQAQYNERFSSPISVDGAVGPHTWGAFFDVYMQELSTILGINAEGLKEKQNKIKAKQLLACPFIGCGEQWPITEDVKANYKTPVDRRVEIRFFDPDEVPSVDCNSPLVACEVLYTKNSFYKPIPVPLNPLPKPSGVAVQIYLQLCFQTPNSKEDPVPFPEGVPVTIEYAKGESDHIETGEHGLLHFFADRVNEAFTLRFAFKEVIYIACPPDSSGNEVAVKLSEIDNYSKANPTHRLLMLPKDWTMAQCNWEVKNADHYDSASYHFRNLEDESIDIIGSEASPVAVMLMPRWQFARFGFFDRISGSSKHNYKQISIPLTLVEGFNIAPLASNASPDAGGKWMSNEDDLIKACHCIPWIIQRKKGGADEPKPDKKSLIQLRTEPSTYIFCQDEKNYKIEVVSDPSLLEPGPDRLKYYDMPEVWLSKNYYTRIAENENGDFYENLSEDDINKSLSYEGRLVFSLDDIVLTDGRLAPVVIAANDQVAIYFHKFLNPNADGSTLPQYPGADPKKIFNSEGLFKPGSDLTKRYYPYSDVTSTKNHYITTYPNWTRLVIAQGNFFDVFDKRTPDTEEIVGARAGVRWVDGVAAGVPPTQNQNVRPAKTTSNKVDSQKSFFAIQPFFSQDMPATMNGDLASGVYREWTSPIPSIAGWLHGRFDVVMLRCCDVVDGNEIAINVQKIRVRHNFGAAITANQRTNFVQKVMQNVPNRWNGISKKNVGTNISPDIKVFNHGNYWLEPQDTAVKLRVVVRWILQETPLPQAHFRVDVPPPPNNSRSFMGPYDGTGGAFIGDEQDGSTGRFTAAHECGHAGSLPDEYMEKWSTCSYTFPGFKCYVPGDPFSIKDGPMMVDNHFIQGRYFWHNAEWIRQITGIPMHVRIEESPTKIYKYKVKSHPLPNAVAPGSNRVFTHHPLMIESDARTGARGQFDLYLYEIGEDQYRYSIKSGKDFDGILVVVVKMRMNFSNATQYAHISKSIESILAEIDNKFNFKFRADSVQPVGGVTFKKCLVYFSPRFLVNNFINDGTAQNNFFIQFLGLPAVTQAAYTAKVNSIDAKNPHDFGVRIDSAVSTGWGNGVAMRQLRFRRDVTISAQAASIGTAFWPYFGHMVGIGLPSGGGSVPSNTQVQNSIVRRPAS